MKQNLTALILAASMALSLCACAGGETGGSSSAPPSSSSPSASSQADAPPWEDVSSSSSPEPSAEGEDAFSFAALETLQFCFSSGAGGWGTLMTIRADGSFSGEYTDSDMGSSGEGYPNGTVYQSNFTGQFTQPVKVNDYTYSTRIQGISYAREAGTQEIRDGVLYQYTEAYGLDGAEDILIYLPGAPLGELPQEFRGWIGYYDLSATPDTELPFYALNNEAQQFGFSSYDIIESLNTILSSAREQAGALEASIQKDSLTQAELNAKSQELYQIWDSVLNALWRDLNRLLDTETMDALTAEEVQWIAGKEQAVKQAGAEYEGGSIQSMVMNQKAAELTEARVYELMELFRSK